MEYQLTFCLSNASIELFNTIKIKLIQNDFIVDDKTFLISKTNKIQTCTDVKQKFTHIIQDVANNLSEYITITNFTILSSPTTNQQTNYDDCIEEILTFSPDK